MIALHGQGDIIGANGAFADFFHAEIVRRGVVNKISALLTVARDADATVIYTKIVFKPDYSDLNTNSPLLQIVQQKGSLQEGSDLTEIIEALTPAGSDLVVTNQRVGGFSPELVSILEDRGIDTLLIAGVATNISVESTARAASDHGYRVVVVEDACSAATPEAHAASIESLGLLTSITTSNELHWAPVEEPIEA
ncbi:cysteine hydrolase [Paeniglutamicibacter sp. ABSL32-1]|nr:cysteine hydrolase [Paeniglutamicibacter quisquiliarum]